MIKEELPVAQATRNQLTPDTLDNSVLKTKKRDLSVLGYHLFDVFFPSSTRNSLVKAGDN